MYSIGIDSGSSATKTVLFHKEKGMVDYSIVPTGWSPKTTSICALEDMLSRNNLKREDVKNVVGTGYGRISMDFIDKKVTEITCHAKGAFYKNPSIRTILDIGGQDSKVISLDEYGNVQEFLMNDKCAAGTGKFLAVMSNSLGLDISELSNLDEEKEPCSITSMCTVFAESEVISLLAKGAGKENIALGVINSIANRASSLLGKIRTDDTIAFTGGVARSSIVRSFIEKKISKSVYVPENSQIIGALGAAIIGQK